MEDQPESNKNTQFQNYQQLQNQQLANSYPSSQQYPPYIQQSTNNPQYVRTIFFNSIILEKKFPKLSTFTLSMNSIFNS